MAFFESELLRMGKGEYDLSEMFVVYHTMLDRADKFVRTQGADKFSQGGGPQDAVYCLGHYGIVPQEAMDGTVQGKSGYDHRKLSHTADNYLKTLTRSYMKRLTPAWKGKLIDIYNSHLGRCPERFTYKGKEYTPQSFAKSLGLNAGDYIALTSFTHHPFYTEFPVEVPDNWRNGHSRNIPLDELMAVIDSAINRGYTVLWASDTSETGFLRNGIATVPEMKEADITQELRQNSFDTWETTDDHNMLIYGIAQDQYGEEYYMVKNSWGKRGKFGGVWYVSKAYVRYKTINILVNAKAIATTSSPPSSYTTT